MEPSEELKNIFSEFNTGSGFKSAARIGSGHINETYRVSTNHPKKSYTLQKINSNIFKDIPNLMKNIEVVTRHLENKIISGDKEAGSFSALRLIPTRHNQLFHEDPSGNYWRLYNFIKGISFDTVTNTDYAFKGGKAFGLFQFLTSDVPIESLSETIPNFHNIEKRLESFHKVVNADPVNRVKHLIREIEFVKRREDEMMLLQNLINNGKIPIRVTHNDTKFNNILFDQKDNAVCIVDLDTVMPGTVLFDFGDAIRTGANRAVEDESDLGKVSIDIDLFEAYSKGYMEIACRFLNPEEVSNLAFSAKFMTFIIGLRFLTDHIDGDKYYRIHFPGHNIQRARSQFRLLETMEQKFDKMKAIIARIVAGKV